MKRKTLIFSVIFVALLLINISASMQSGEKVEIIPVKTAATDDNFEENDIHDDAIALPGTSYSLIANDDDWFTISVPTQGSTLTISISFDPSDTNIYLYLYDGQNIGITPIDSSTDQGARTQSVDVITASNSLTFYLHVDPETHDTGTSYEMTISITGGSSSSAEDTYEDNDILDQATDLSPGTYNNLYCADDDWYSFYMASGETLTVTINFNNAQGDLDLFLNSEIGGTVTHHTSDSSTSDSESITFKLESGSGNVQIRVYKKGNANSYSMTITVEAPGLEAYIVPLIVLMGVIALVAVVVVKKKRGGGKAKTTKKGKVAPIESDKVKISRGFEVAGDTFRFFIRIENILDYAITNVSVRIILPRTLVLDKKTKSKTYKIGDIQPGKFGTGIFYLFCEACADTEINATVEYKDPKGTFEVTKMRPFQIFSCKYVQPRQISIADFDKKFYSEEKKTVRINLKEGLSKEEIMQMLKDRLTMSTIESTPDSMEMAGMTNDGKEVLLKTIIEETLDGKVLVVSVVSENEHVQMGALSDVLEEFKDFRREMRERLTGLKEGQEDIKATVIAEATRILTNQIVEFESMKIRNSEIDRKISETSNLIIKLEGEGAFDQAGELKQQLSTFREEFQRSHQSLAQRMDGMVDNLDKILENQDDLEAFLVKRLGNEFDKIKHAWTDFKEGKINRKKLILQSLSVVCVIFAKFLIGK